MQCKVGYFPYFFMKKRALSKKKGVVGGMTDSYLKNKNLFYMWEPKFVPHSELWCRKLKTKENKL